MPAGRGVAVLALLGASALAFGAYIYMDRISLLTATATAGRSGVWVYTPHVAPGDAIAIEVVVKGGKRLGIQEVKVQAGERVLQVRGEGQTWGSSFTTRRRDTGQDEVELAVQVPPDAVAGSTLPVDLEVSWIAAESDGVGSFENREGFDRIHVAIPVRTPAMRTVRRALSAGWSLALLALACLVMAVAGHKLGPTLNRKDGDQGLAEALGIVLIVAIIAYGFAGYGWFALPLVAATGILGTWFIVLAVAVWLVVPVYLAVRYVRRAPKLTRSGLRSVAVEPETPYRTMATDERLPDRAVEPRPVADVIAAAQAAKLAVKPRRRGFDLRRDGHILRVRGDDVARVQPRTMQIHTDHVELDIDLAFALVPMFGPLAVDTASVGEIVIDGVRDRAAVDDELSERVRALARRILDRLNRTQPMLDELQRKLGR